MQKETRRKASFKIEQIIGELILYAPLIILSYFMGTLISCIITMMCVFVFKYFFYYSLHLYKWYWCMTLSYSLFIVITVFYKGLGLTTPFLENQPMLLVIVSVGVAYLNHYAGLWQHKLTHKNIYAMSAEELHNYCCSKGFDESYCKIAELIIIKRLKGQALYAAMGYSPSQAKRIRKKILKHLKH